MSEPIAPVYEPLPAPAPVGPAKGNVFGTVALVLGIIAMVFCFIPVAGIAAFILGPLAIVFAIVGLTRKHAKKGTSIAGLILGAIAIVVAIIVTIVISIAVSSIDKSVNAEHQIDYVVTSAGPAHVSYWTGGGTSTEDITADWKKSVTAKGFEISSLTVTGDYATAGQVSCEILVDGKSISKNSGSGTGANALCSGSTSSSK
ncbi:hypothetical protein [Arthrobacter sp. H14-L1]|uniref:hypothetical protein n=1 Tax=Arthrobacter sp. H14-L1 TaxID=2996697 RepID=UPI00226DF3B6|nr:hypothetical protein [Arthrobacter sp. H14-L1]MCY0905853.1 hypothetical protein [Arthrobacter sp. H14-L1]